MPSSVVHTLCFFVMHYLASITCPIVQWEYFMVLIVFSHIADIIHSNLEKKQKAKWVISSFDEELLFNGYWHRAISSLNSRVFLIAHGTEFFLQVPPVNIAPHNRDLDGYCFGAGVRYQVNYANGQVASVSLMGIYARAPKTTYRLSICSRRIGCAWLGGKTL